jgi:ABC-type dipeptide/oligopeptide/nickel transport system permease component
LRRLRSFAATAASIPITLFGLVLITFLIGRVVPIDPVLAVVGDRAPQDVVERTRREMGLDRPLPEQFVRYTGQLLQGDLGRSVMTSNRVFYATLGWAPGPGRQDVIFQDMVPQVTGLLLVDAVIAQDWDALHDAAAHLALPALVLGAFNMAYIARMTRAFMLESLRGEYVVTARAKGLPAWSVIWRHGFGNILVRLITVIALTYAGLLEGAVLTETIFSWPGLGQYLTGSLLNADMNAVLGATLVVGLTYLALNLFADLMYRVLDPRVR